MPKLPSGRFVEIMSDRARCHAARRKVRVIAPTRACLCLAQKPPIFSIPSLYVRTSTNQQKAIQWLW